MKKSKVDRLIKKHADEARAAGERAGAAKERARYESVMLPQRDGITWLGEPPRSMHITIAMPQGFRAMQFDPNSYDRMFERSSTRIDFRLRQKGITLANGVVIRWADWEPMGPYPVSDIAEPPRSW